MKIYASFALLLAILVPSHGLVVNWGQCGGVNWQQETECNSGWTCHFYNEYYSQCEPIINSPLPSSSTVDAGTTTCWTQTFPTVTSSSNPATATATQASSSMSVNPTGQCWTYVVGLPTGSVTPTITITSKTTDKVTPTTTGSGPLHTYTVCS